MPRLARILLTVALAACAVPMVSVVGEAAALADDQDELAIGTELQATSDVTLHQAEIAKGSRVNVTKVLVRAGRVDGVSVALADGHVVKMTLGQVHTFFRVVHD
ncbi:Hypothetical protein A7982_10358 [Minicystis rosea]|nr:Hypothetical protein A7982_10358 [Minicystis rosea]